MNFKRFRCCCVFFVQIAVDLDWHVTPAKGYKNTKNMQHNNTHKHQRGNTAQQGSFTLTPVAPGSHWAAFVHVTKNIDFALLLSTSASVCSASLLGVLKQVRKLGSV
jgi:hypothetical protein